MFLKTEIEPPLKFAVTNSAFPSRSKSLAAILCEPDPVIKSIRGANEIVPIVLVFLKIDTPVNPLNAQATATSNFPSPSKSAMQTPKGLCPDV